MLNSVACFLALKIFQKFENNIILIMCFGFNLVMVILVLALRSCEVGSVASLIKQTGKAQKGKASYSVATYKNVGKQKAEY